MEKTCKAHTYTCRKSVFVAHRNSCNGQLNIENSRLLAFPIYLQADHFIDGAAMIYILYL